MSTGWESLDPPGTAPWPGAPWTARRRAQLSARFPHEAIIVAAGRPKVRSNDIDYAFRADSDFAWLTGHYEPFAVLVMAPTPDGHQATLFVPDRIDRSSSSFFTDPRHGELWVGRRPGPDEVSVALSLPTAPLDDFERACKALDGCRVRLLAGVDHEVEAIVASTGLEAHSDRQAELRLVLSRLRLEKDDYEVACIEAAVAATVRGFEDIVRELPRAMATSERWVEGTFSRRARVEGNDVAYGVIAAAGPHACTLHWVRNDGPVKAGDLLLVDAGVEVHDLYAADVTRTLPVSGRFTSVQREVYDVVWDAQQAALAVCSPGNDFAAVHRAASRVLATWLVERGFLACSVETALDEGLHRRFTLHGTSHMLGLDVHDCATARNEYTAGELRPGMVLTVEPGCYFQPDDLTVPEEYRGIGVRIEDDVLVTPGGCRVLSAALPTRADAVEAWMAQLAM